MAFDFNHVRYITKIKFIQKHLLESVHFDEDEDAMFLIPYLPVMNVGYSRLANLPPRFGLYLSIVTPLI
ncbi:hypothetical protein L1887_05671 [Cichorium endivia]|nr:hypothetical protein L1887_05671 [Cichorium endivia]